MIIRSLDDVTRDALAAMARTDDPRLREILTALVKHLHAFVRETRLTEAEFRAATAVVNEIGQRSNDSHNEAVLMAGSLGVSSLVCLLANGVEGSAETSQSLLGPFWRLHSPRVANGGSLLRSETPGEPSVRDRAAWSTRRARRSRARRSTSGTPRPIGLYENQDSRAGRDEPARQVCDRRRRPLLVLDGEDGRLSDSDRRRRRAPAACAEPPAETAGASARADRQAGLQGSDLAGLRPRATRTSRTTRSSA